MLLTLQPAHLFGDGARRADGRTTRRQRGRAAAVPVVEPTGVEFTWANRRPGTAGFARWVAQVGARLDEHGLTANADDVERLVATARRLGVALVAADVLADPAEPDVVRHRAFSHVASALTCLPAA